MEDINVPKRVVHKLIYFLNLNLYFLQIFFVVADHLGEVNAPNPDFTKSNQCTICIRCFNIWRRTVSNS